MAERLIGIPGDLIYANAASIEAKIARFEDVGADRMHIIFDFDRTLTIARPGSDEDITTWHLMKEHLPEVGKQQYQQLFEHYRALELTGTMSQEHAVIWWSSILDLFVEHKVNIQEVESDFLEKATIRPQTKELFDLCEQAGIPTIIMSAGIKEVIDIWARAYQIHPTIVISTALQLSLQGVVEGWNQSSLVHVLNKCEQDHPQLSQIRRDRPYALVIGDGMSDADMATGDENVLRVRIHDPRADEKSSQAATQSTFERFDFMIQTGTLMPARLLIERLVTTSQKPGTGQ